MPVSETMPVGSPGQTLGLVIQLAPPDAGSGASRALHGIDPNALYGRQVDHEATVTNGAASNIMASATHRHQQVVVAGEMDGVDDIRDPTTTDDQAGPSIDIAVPDLASLIIAAYRRER